MSGFVRCILGDVPATSALGRCDAHEHVVLAGSFIAKQHPELDLSDTDAAVRELKGFASAGGGWVVDAMPTCCSRRPRELAQVSRQSGVPIVMSTGRHLAQYYPAGDAHVMLGRDALRELMIREIEEGVDGRRCGLIKVAGGAGKLSEIEREAFIAAAQAQQTTGCPIMTHTEADADGVWDQINTLVDHGASVDNVVLSHLDKSPDVVLHLDVLQSGVRLEYDQHFRRLQRNDDRQPGPFELIGAVVEAFPDAVVLGMDMARRSYWTERGGRPGLSWFLTDLPTGLAQVGLNANQIDALFIDNPIAALHFSPSVSTQNASIIHTTTNETAP